MAYGRGDVRTGRTIFDKTCEPKSNFHGMQAGT